MKKIIFVSLSIIALLLFGCGPSSSVTRVGSATYPPLSGDAIVLVFSKESDVQKPFVTVGMISYTNPGKYQILTLDNAIPELKKQARSVGANGIIIDDSYPIKSGMISTGIGVRARAILISENK